VTGQAPAARRLAGRWRVPWRTPRADLDGTGRLVPALVLRAGVVAAGALLVSLLTVGRPAGWLVLLLAALVAGVAWSPGSVLVGVLGVLAAGVQLAFGGFDVRAVAAALALHLVWLLAAVAALVPARGRVELAALRPAAGRFVAVVGATALLAALVAGARAGGVRAGEQLLLLVGIVVLAAGAGLAVLVWGRRRHW
jgi:hypothetical protein